MENIRNLKENNSKLPDSYLNSFKKRIYSTILQSQGENPEDWLYFFMKTVGKIKSDIRTNSVDYLKKLDVSAVKNKEELANFIGEELFRFYNENYTLEEIKNFSREDLKKFGFLEINEVLSYDFNETKTVINIHTPITPTNDISEYVIALIDGFKKLAQKIKSEKEFSSVEKIEGSSWIIYYHRKFVTEKLGFVIESIDENLKNATAFISREEFLEKYGDL